MSIESYLQFPSSYQPVPASEPKAPEPDESVLDDLIHQKSRILGKKLEILASEIWWRLHIADRNLKSLDADKALATQMLRQLTRAANYLAREHKEKDAFYRRLFDIEFEKRSQQVECWRDVVMVMRDFLYVWEAHEQTRSRAIFLQNVGRTNPEPV